MSHNFYVEDTINYLMSKAMGTIAFLPYSYLMDQWRWDVFSGKIKPDNYNKAWWDLRSVLPTKVKKFVTTPKSGLCKIKFTHAFTTNYPIQLDPH